MLTPVKGHLEWCVLVLLYFSDLVQCEFIAACVCMRVCVSVCVCAHDFSICPLQETKMSNPSQKKWNARSINHDHSQMLICND